MMGGSSGTGGLKGFHEKSFKESKNRRGYVKKTVRKPAIRIRTWWGTEARGRAPARRR